MRRLALATDGVLAVHRPGELRLGPEAGDLVVYCQAGWRFSDPDYTNNPIPGNHGHPATLPIPFFLSGGSRRVRRGSSTARAHTLDVAPDGRTLLRPRPPRAAGTTAAPASPSHEGGGQLRDDAVHHGHQVAARALGDPPLPLVGGATGDHVGDRGQLSGAVQPLRGGREALDAGRPGRR